MSKEWSKTAAAVGNFRRADSFYDNRQLQWTLWKFFPVIKSFLNQENIFGCYIFGQILISLEVSHVIRRLYTAIHNGLRGVSIRVNFIL